MYMIRRTDRDFGEPKVPHDDLAEAIAEANRLAKIHAAEEPEFTVYEFTPIVVVKGTVSITEEYVRHLKNAKL